MVKSQQGFSKIILPIIIFLAVIVLVLLVTLIRNPGPSFSPNIYFNNLGVQYSSRNTLPSCNGNTVLTKAPSDPGSYAYIIPLGNVSASSGGASHVVPSDHIYFSNPPSNIHASGEVQAVKATETIPVFAPGDIRIVEVDAKTYTENSTGASANDYSIYFSPCKDVVFYFHHITNINPVITNALEKLNNKKCGSQPLDNFQFQSCNYFNTEIDIKAGEKVGLGAYDFGMYDFRQTPQAFIDKDKATTLFAACPLDYFTDPARVEMYKKVINTKLNSHGLPDCGTNMHDLDGTIQGNWYLPQTQNQNKGGVQNTRELAVLHLNTNSDIGVIAWGGVIATSGQLHFALSQSGKFNREPSQVKPDGKIYCFEKTSGLKELYSSFGQSFQPPYHILLQLVDEKTLKAEYQNGSCTDSSSFSNPTTYIR